MFTSTFWKRATLGAGLVAALLASVPNATAEGRFRPPYGDGPGAPGPVGERAPSARLHVSAAGLLGPVRAQPR